MRGLRASIGKSLLDVQRDLKIKASHIDAIENADASALPNRGFVSGFVRAYARYLGMDEHETLNRFVDEAGLERTEIAAASVMSGARKTEDAAALGGPHLAAAARAPSLDIDWGGIARGVGSLATLVALIAGLGYGGWALLQNVQRVNFAPAPDAPLAMANAPDLIGLPQVARAGVAPASMIDAPMRASYYDQQSAPPPKFDRRDGPIAALDPQHSGVYATRAHAAATAPQVDQGSTTELTLDPAFRAELDRLAEAAALGAQVAQPGDDATHLRPAATRGLRLVFAGEAWIRVRGADGRILHQALMQGGQDWAAPQNAEGLRLRAGNAGSVFVEVDGVRYGPLGAPGGVVSRVALDADAIRATLPLAPIATAAIDPGTALTAER